MIDKSIYNGGQFVLLGKLFTGETVRIEFRDLGDTTPGFRKEGARFEAFTTWMRFVWPAAAQMPAHWPPRLPSDRPNYLEDYSQASRTEAERSGDVALFRFYRDLATLTMMQVDVATLEMEPARKGML